MKKLNYKHQLRDAEVIVNYIKEHHGEWTPVTLQVIKDIVGVNTCYASGVYQTLKQHEGLESKMVYLNNHKGHRMLEFRPKAASKLTAEQQQHIVNVLSSHGMSEDHSEGTMNIVNFLANSGAVEGFVEDYIQKAADLLIMKRSNVVLYTQMLIRYGLAEEIDGNSLKLIVPESSEIQNQEPAPVAAAKEPDPADTPPKKRKGPEKGKPRGPYKKKNKDGAAAAADVVPPKKERTKKDPAAITKRKPKADPKPKPDSKPKVSSPIPPPVEKPVDPPLESPTATPEAIEPTERAIALSDSLIRFGDIVSGFREFFDIKANEVMTEYQAIAGSTESLEVLLSEKNQMISNLNALIEEKNSQLEEGNNVLKNLAEDNAALRQQVDRYRKESDKNAQYHSVQVRHNEKLFEVMQLQLQIMTADINTTIVDYTRIPAWEVKPSDTARVQSTVITAMTSAMGEIVRANAKGFSAEDV